MNWKAWAPLLIAIVLGVIAAKIAKDMTAKNQTTDIVNPKLTRVVVAKQAIQPGQALKEEDIALAAFPPEQLPEGTFANTSDVVGRVVLAQLIKGQTIVHTLLATPGTGTGLQALVPDGMRAITIDVNEASSVAGLLTPGCHVDVVASLNDPVVGAMMARTLVQNVKVQALGSKIVLGAKAEGEDPNAPQQFKTVTLVVTPEEAEKVELASIAGRPRLVLRSSTDNAPYESTGISLMELTNHHNEVMAPPKAIPVVFGDPTTPTTAPAAMSPTTRPAQVAATQPVEEPQTRTIEVIRGASPTNVAVPIKTQQPLPNSQGASLDPFSK